MLDHYGNIKVRLNTPDEVKRFIDENNFLYGIQCWNSGHSNTLDKDDWLFGNDKTLLIKSFCDWANSQPVIKWESYPEEIKVFTGDQKGWILSNGESKFDYEEFLYYPDNFESQTFESLPEDTEHSEVEKIFFTVMWRNLEWDENYSVTKFPEGRAILQKYLNDWQEDLRRL